MRCAISIKFCFAFFASSVWTTMGKKVVFCGLFDWRCPITSKSVLKQKSLNSAAACLSEFRQCLLFLLSLCNADRQQKMTFNLVTPLQVMDREGRDWSVQRTDWEGLSGLSRFLWFRWSGGTDIYLWFVHVSICVWETERVCLWTCKCET